MKASLPRQTAVAKIIPMTWANVFRLVAILVWLGGDIVRAAAERTFFLSDGRVLQSCIYKPKGHGPFPAVVFNEPSMKALPADGPVDPFPVLAKFYNSNGYVLFVTGRHTPTTLPSDAPSDPMERQKISIERHKVEVENILSAIATLKAQSYVDAKRVYVTGHSSGASTTLVLAGKNLDVRGYVVFSPAAQIWAEQKLIRDMLQQAVENATAPVFMIQPQNDYGLGPIEVLGKALGDKGPPNRSKVFAPHGNSQKEANNFAIAAPHIWGADVLSFFNEISK